MKPLTLDERYRLYMTNRDVEVRREPIPIAQGISLRHFKFEVTSVRIENYDRFPEQRRIVFRTRVMDRDTGEPLEVIFNEDFPSEEFGDPVRWIKRALMRALDHEIDECLVRDGVRVHDPHG